MSLLFQQIRTLTQKNLLIVFSRQRAAFTYYRAFAIPVVFACYIAFILPVYFPTETYQLGHVVPVRSLADGMNAAGGGRNTLAFVNSGLSGGPIDQVIRAVANEAQSDGKNVKLLGQESDLHVTCPSTLRGVTSCYAAAVFYSSPSEGPGGFWNYTIKADGSFGQNVNLGNSNNDAQIYTIPLQHAIDAAITSLHGNNASLPSRVDEYPYASKTQHEFRDSIRNTLQKTVINAIACVLFLAFSGVVYQLVGLMAMERELGMSQLIESMMPNTRHWEPQAARLMSFFFAFSIVYFPGFVVIGIVLKVGLFVKTSGGVVVVFIILAGLASTSFSVLGGAFFKKAQLSGVSAVGVAVGLAIIAQVVSKESTGTIIILGLLFTPCTVVYFAIFMARFETQNLATKLLKGPPQSPWNVPGIVFWIFLIIQIFVYPMIAAIVERSLYDTASKGRTLSWQLGETTNPVRLTNVTKHYLPNGFLRYIAPLFGHKTKPVVAVNNLTMTATKGQITVLVGANGSGKSTTLDLVAGLTSVTGGAVALDGTGGIGVCPQKNVLWETLSVEQHVTVFNKLKSSSWDSKAQVRDLIAKCGLKSKYNALVKTLSGGQKRKVQLMMMLTGGSRVCCVDEVSGGLDPLSRRHVWDILIAERGTRTVLLTTHFLDEAEYLADHIVVLSKGSLKAEGSSVELKNKLGGGYRVEVMHGPDDGPTPNTTLDGVSKVETHNETTYIVPDPAYGLRLIKLLEDEGISNYRITSPTLQEVFMKLAEEATDESDSDILPYPQEPRPEEAHRIGSHTKENALMTIASRDKEVTLQTGRPISLLRQAFVLFRKRLTITMRNSFPSVAAVCIPIIAAGILTLLLRHHQIAGCSRTDQVDISDNQNLSKNINISLVIGPRSALSPENLKLFSNGFSSVINPGGSGSASLLQSIHTVDTLDEFNLYIKDNFSIVNPGGIFLGGNGESPTFAYKADGAPYSDVEGGLVSSVVMQNVLDVLLTNVSIGTQFNTFDVPWAGGTGKVLQVVFYFGLAMAAYPAFFALYPSIERSRKVRALEYSNGVRALPLWLAYLAFDSILVLIASAAALIIYAAATSQAWYHVGYLFIIFFLYGVTSILLSYVISLVAISQLAAFASSAGGQALMVVLYMTAYFQVIANAPADKMNDYILICHFTIALITPVGNLVRGLLIGLNVFNILCEGNPPATASNPGRLTLYGGPILYLIGQSFFLFGILLLADSNVSLSRYFKRFAQSLLIAIFMLANSSLPSLFRKGKTPRDPEDTQTREKEVSDEIHRVASSDDGLRLLHLTKSFKEKFRSKSAVAVDDLTLGVMNGEVFALVGPNGAGKSTTLSLIRGEFHTDHNRGEIYVDDHSVKRQREIARSHLGVCPQFDAMDQMTVLEHLRFYAGVRGVQDVEHNVTEVVKAVGLQPFKDRVASKLSGGNKRKLSLGIALVGNPKVLLLDEPSSGMDPVAKRQMWKILSTIAPGRSILLTTHSMEEASFLSPRIGILAKRLLDIGSPHHLRLKHADGYHIHLITASGPTATDDEYHAITTWMQQHIPGAELDGRPWHGQMRFSIPATHNSEISQETEKTGLDTENPIPANGVKKTPSHSNPTATTRELDRIDSVFPQPPSQSSSTPITTGNLFALLESSKAHLAISHYTVSPNTFDEVFLNIVRKHNIDEEDFLTKPGWKWKGWKKGWQRERPEVDNDGNGGPGTGEVGERGVETRRFRWKWKWLLWPYVR